MTRRAEFINKLIELFKEDKITIIYTTIFPNREGLLIRNKNNDSEPHVCFWRMQSDVCMMSGGKWVGYYEAYRIVKEYIVGEKDEDL